MRFANFRLHLAAPWLSARAENDGIVASAAGEEFRFDFAIAGTGYFVDPAARPELADFAHHILLWRDRFTPPEGEEDPYLGAHPYLGVGAGIPRKACPALPPISRTSTCRTRRVLSAAASRSATCRA